MSQAKPVQRPTPSFWAGKRVLVTGHTGFKGSWLTLWLNRLGAAVTGIGLAPETTPALFELARVATTMQDSQFADIRDAAAMKSIIAETRPQIVFHLAAQPLVLPSYDDPLGTFSTNVQGTAHMLDALRGISSVRVAIMITTDKVYENPEDGFPFRETDPLGGYDPYSASKAAAEIVIASFRRSFLAGQGVAVASARAGNVIGGGDWSRHRLIPDAVRAWQSGAPLVIRQPDAMRPWQHVLEPLAGYLALAEASWRDASISGAYNFGPETHEVASVREVIALAQKAYGSGQVDVQDGRLAAHEARWLSLEVTKARRTVGVMPRWGLRESVSRTMHWYSQQQAGGDAAELCLSDIVAFEAVGGRHVHYAEEHHAP
jgi:CDP-glucose 4,6-dehydratase